MTDLHLAVALDGLGWHPAAWRDLARRTPRAVFTARLLDAAGPGGRRRGCSTS